MTLTAAHAAITPATLLRFLIGDRQAILAFARSRHTLTIGAILVLAAGLAREFDQEDLLARPWFLAIPFAASTVVAFLVFLVTRRWDEGRAFGPDFRGFLGLFWMTAPVALLYGIPYERFLSPAGAMSANLWTLAAVSLWRVVLMARIVSVCFGRHPAASFLLIMPIADGVAFLGLILMPVPLMNFMGGIKLTEAERMLSSLHFLAQNLTMLSWPVWLIAAVASRMARRPLPDLYGDGPSPTRATWALAIAAVVIWLPLLPITQPEQQRKTAVERAMLGGDIAGALAELSRHQPAEYPPGWSPPPQVGWRNERPNLLDVMDALLARPETSPWVRREFVDKFERRFLASFWFWQQEDTPRILAVLDRLPEGPELRQKYAHRFEDGPATRPAR